MLLALWSVFIFRLSGIPQYWYNRVPSLPILPNLKILKICDYCKDMVYPDDEWNELPHPDAISFPIFPLSIAFPRLEQLFIGPNLPYLDPAPVWMWREKAKDIWPHLKVLIFDPEIFIGRTSGAEKTHDTLRHLTRLTSLQHITLELEMEDWPCMFSDSDDLLSDADIAQCSKFQNLHSFSSQSMCISPDGARALLSNAIKSYQLTSFDLVFPWRDHEGHSSIDHLKNYEWLCGAPSIHTLRCYGFGLQPILQYDGGLFLPRFLATFPNLRTLSIAPRDCPLHLEDTYFNLVIAIMRLTHLETIYVESFDRECNPFHTADYHPQLQQAARDQGVRIHSHPRPLQWPMPLSAK
ncbi:hypothetical protein E4U11_002328 [Claviceps purpurea]|nr:hypothetical protein E4U11_002328 [Claviceps purpurea]